jgi:hypothetical protein
MALDPNVIYAEGRCYNCYGPVADFQLLKLALLRRTLLGLNPSADTSPEALLIYGSCYNCYSNGSEYDIMELSLLDQIAQAA